MHKLSFTAYEPYEYYFYTLTHSFKIHSTVRNLDLKTILTPHNLSCIANNFTSLEKINFKVESTDLEIGLEQLVAKNKNLRKISLELQITEIEEMSNELDVADVEIIYNITGILSRCEKLRGLSLYSMFHQKWEWTEEEVLL